MTNPVLLAVESAAAAGTKLLQTTYKHHYNKQKFPKTQT
jgi:hypothetical protein